VNAFTKANQTDEIPGFHPTGTVPPDLEKLGLVAYLDVRKRANPKDNERAMVEV
jgi:hypothetical protein